MSITVVSSELLSLDYHITGCNDNLLTMRTPNDHQSAVVPWPFLLTTSGAMYSTVPQKENVLRSSTASLLRPKSVCVSVCVLDVCVCVLDVCVCDLCVHVCVSVHVCVLP